MEPAEIRIIDGVTVYFYRPHQLEEQALRLIFNNADVYWQHRSSTTSNLIQSHGDSVSSMTPRCHTSGV